MYLTKETKLSQKLRRQAGASSARAAFNPSEASPEMIEAGVAAAVPLVGEVTLDFLVRAVYEAFARKRAEIDRRGAG